jgi:hypothetical protein
MHEHDLYETVNGWWCRVCGHRVLAFQRVSFLTVWAKCRELRRAINEWETEEQ